MKKRLIPADRVFDKTGNKYLSACIIMQRARQKSEKNAVFANEMNIRPDNKNVVEETAKEFLSDELDSEFRVEKK